MGESAVMKKRFLPGRTCPGGELKREDRRVGPGRD